MQSGPAADRHTVVRITTDLAPPTPTSDVPGTGLQLEGALSFTERKVKDQLSKIEKLQAQVASLSTELQQARGAAAVTPDRCRTAARVLQAEADRCALGIPSVDS